MGGPLHHSFHVCFISWFITFVSVEVILKCDNSNKIVSAVLLRVCGTFCLLYINLFYLSVFGQLVLCVGIDHLCMSLIFWRGTVQF